ncbi:MAG: hypothetical protein OES79_07645 [Planctomycetota bacterium]|nr:hypothetical protein [Planctomycetota bacterium]
MHQIAKSILVACCFFGLSLVIAGLLTVQAAAADASDVTVTTLLDGLHNPCGVAVQPGTGDVFVSDSGQGRILRVVGDRAEPAITGFPRETFGDAASGQQTRFDIGPLGLVFLDQNTLVVGGGGLQHGAELLRMFQVPPRGKSINVDQMKLALGPIPASDASSSGEGDFFGVAALKKTIYVTCHGDDDKGWVARSLQDEQTWNALRPFTPTKLQTGVDAPAGITISQDGHLVVAQIGELDVPRDSRLGFYDPVEGDLLTSYATGLHDVVALAYSPRSGRLYALDFAWGQQHKDGGLYRLDAVMRDKKPAVQAVKIVELNHPTALAFASNASLLVTVIGTTEGAADKQTGKLLRISGRL